MRPSAPTSARATPAAGQQRARRGAADATGLVTTSLRVSHGRAVLQPRTAAVRGTLHCCAVRAPRKPEWLTIESIYMRLLCPLCCNPSPKIPVTSAACLGVSFSGGHPSSSQILHIVPSLFHHVCMGRGHCLHLQLSHSSQQVGGDLEAVGRDVRAADGVSNDTVQPVGGVTLKLIYLYILK